MVPNWALFTPNLEFKASMLRSWSQLKLLFGFHNDGLLQIDNNWNSHCPEKTLKESKMEQFYPSLVQNFICLVHGIHFSISKDFPKILNYCETRWSYSSKFFEKTYVLGLKWSTFTQFGSKTSSTLFLESTLTILSAILQDYNLMCKRKWQKCTYNP